VRDLKEEGIDCGGDCRACGSAIPSSLLLPSMSKLDPSIGGAGDLITVWGENFGEAGKVFFVKGKEEKLGEISTPEICPQAVWTSSAVVARVPDFSPGSALVKVVREDGEESASVPFRIINETSRPGLCALDPAVGPLGISVTFEGEKFGATRGAAESSGAQFFDKQEGEIEAWDENRLEAIVPENAKTGSAQVKAGGLLSNKLPFEVRDCREEGCEGNLACCLDGSCRLKEGCQHAIPKDRYVWAFTTQGAKLLAFGKPCSKNEECQSGVCEKGFCTDPELSLLKILSSYPRNNQINVCRNSVLNLTFNQRLDEAAIEKFFYLEEFTLSQWRSLGGVTIPLRHRTQGKSEWSEVSLSPQEPLAPRTSYRLVVKGGEKGIKSFNGKAILQDFIIRFSTGDIICQIKDIVLSIDPVPPGRLDLFTCGRNDCAGDQNGLMSGNQHRYFAQARDGFGAPLTASYLWSFVSAPELAEHVISFEKVVGNDIFITAKAQNGRETIKVEASGPPEQGEKARLWGSASRLQEIEVFLCDNPWPASSSFPFKDQNTNFSFFYCRDQGAMGFNDDLPALRIVPVPVPPDPRILKEFLFPLPDSTEGIGVRVMKNEGHNSPLSWYEDNFMPERQGKPTPLLIDGYEAIRDGTTSYVDAANIRYPNDFFTNIYILSYTGNAGISPDLSNILNQLLASWRFNININPEDKPLLTRDTKRLADLADLSRALAKKKQETGRFPRLSAGSFIAGSSTSRWPSWEQTLGAELGIPMPLDPANKFGACPGFDFNTCWNETTKRFAGSLPNQMPEGSSVYVYKVLDREGFKYLLCAVMETEFPNRAKSMFVCPQSAKRVIGRGGIGLNRAPIILPGPLPVIVLKDEPFYIQAEDPDGDALTWRILERNEGLQGPFQTTVGDIRRFTASSSGRLSLMVEDEFNGAARSDIPIQVLP
jgi:hypothetical protein